MISASAVLASDRSQAAQRWRLAVFLSTWTTYASFYLTRKSLSVAKIGIGEDPSFLLSNDTLGWLDGSYLAAYTVGMFLWGPVADRFGTRRVIAVGVTGCVVTALLAGFTPSRAVFAAAVIASGLFQSSGWGPLNKTMSAWFSLRERGQVMGLWCTSYAIGGLVASPFAALMVSAFGHWRFAFLGPAVTLAAIGAVCVVVQRDRPADVGLPAVEADAAPADKRVIREVLRNRTVWLLGLVYFLLKPTRYALLFWGPKYLHERLGTDVTESSLLSALFELGGPLGIILLGVVSDRYLQSRRFPVMVVPLVLLGILLFGFDTVVGTGSVGTAFALFAMGLLVFAPDAFTSSVAAMDFGRQRGAGTATGMVNGMGSLGAILGGSVPGFVSERYGWQGVFVGLGIASIAAALLLVPSWNRVPSKA